MWVYTVVDMLYINPGISAAKSSEIFFGTFSKMDLIPIHTISEAMNINRIAQRLKICLTLIIFLQMIIIFNSQGD